MVGYVRCGGIVHEMDDLRSWLGHPGPGTWADQAGTS